MPNHPSRTSVHLDVSAGAERRPEEMPDDLPFRILVLADLSGRANSEHRAPLAGRRPIAIDRDNLDDVLSRIKPSLRLADLDLPFNQLDDFHPDQLYDRMPVFRKLAQLREQPPQAQTPPAPPPANLLNSILEQAQPDTPADIDDTDDLAAFLKRATASSLEPREDPRRQTWAARTDTTSAELMRGIVHHPGFQKLEAAWRAVAFLVNRLETNDLLKIYILDVTLEELLDDETAVHTLFTRRDDPWAVIVGDFSFGQTDADATRLQRLARAAHTAGAPFLAEALPPSGNPSPEWQAFRRSADAAWIGLALPRFLLRLPYGAETSAIDRFAFEEMPHPEHGSYLWGNPAFCCALLLGQAFLREGWQMRPGVVREIQSLPLHLYKEDGQTVPKPCAEVLMTEREADYVMESGFMPLASLKSTDSVLLVRFQSIAEPLHALSGRWSSSFSAAAVE